MIKLESFFWGIIAALGAIVVQFVFFILFSTFADPTEKLSYAYFFSIPSFIVAIAFIEEFFKYLILVKKIPSLLSKKTIFFSTILLGIGFFSVEFVLILNSDVIPSPQSLLEIATLHLGTTMLMGYFIMIAKANKRTAIPIILPLLFATFLHFSYNLLVSQENSISSNITLAGLIILILVNFFLFYTDKTLAQD